MTGVLEDLASTDFVDLNGTRITATLPLRESLLNESVNSALAHSRARIQQIALTVLMQNRIAAAVKVKVGPFSTWFRLELVINPQLLWSQMPILLVSVASARYAPLVWLVELFAKETLPKAIKIKGQQIGLDLTTILQADQFQALYPHVNRLSLDTTPGTIWIRLELNIQK